MRAAGIGSQVWQLPDAISLPDDFLPDVPILTREIVWRRGYTAPDEAHRFVNPLEFSLPPSGSYPCLATAVDRIVRAIGADEQIWVWGDFDADGQTATAVLVGGLRRLGCRVEYFIPDRITEAHGLNASGLDTIAASGCTLLITCDCGTNDVEMAIHARSLGLDTIISDHHQQISPIPPAVAVVNSSHVDRSDPIWGIPGVAVAYLLLRDLAARLGSDGFEDSELDLVALGVVADLAPNTVANRALIARGLPLLWRTTRPGVRALLDLVGVPAQALDSAKISYKLAPLLNAAGRLASASVGVELLLAPDATTATALASDLLTLNQERQRLTELLEQDIDRRILPEMLERPVFFVAGDCWHPGLIGPAANHYAARFHKPAAIVTANRGDSTLRGSIRGSGTYDVLAALATQAHLLDEWGGHPGAAGFTLAATNYASFVSGLSDAIAAMPAGTTGPALAIDAVVPWSSIREAEFGSGSVYGAIALLAPFAEGNPEPILASQDLRFVSKRSFGQDEAYADLVFADRNCVEHAVKWWRHDRSWRPAGRYDVAYTVSVDTWQGRSRLRLTLVSLRPAG